MGLGRTGLVTGCPGPPQVAESFVSVAAGLGCFLSFPHQRSLSVSLSRAQLGRQLRPQLCSAEVRMPAQSVSLKGAGSGPSIRRTSHTLRVSTATWK